MNVVFNHFNGDYLYCLLVKTWYIDVPGLWSTNLVIQHILKQYLMNMLYEAGIAYTV